MANSLISDNIAAQIARLPGIFLVFVLNWGIECAISLTSLLALSVATE